MVSGRSSGGSPISSGVGAAGMVADADAALEDCDDDESPPKVTLGGGVDSLEAVAAAVGREARISSVLLLIHASFQTGSAGTMRPGSGAGPSTRLRLLKRTVAFFLQTVQPLELLSLGRS